MTQISLVPSQGRDMGQIAAAQRSFGDHLKAWRQRRRRSQLDFALDAEISQKHLSFIETGRSTPSRDMVIRLTEALDIPLRERNLMLLSAGYAPLYLSRSLDDPSLQPARAAIDLILQGHEPYPAVAVDRHWTLIAANAAVAPLLAGVKDTRLTDAPINVLRLSLHPDGLAPHIANLAQWRKHLLERLKHQIDVTADTKLIALDRELRGYPCDAGAEGPLTHDTDIVVPLLLTTEQGTLAFFSTVTVFGTPVDITLSEIAIESFFPADEATRKALRSPAA